MQSDQDRWNDKYRDKDFPCDPTQIVLDYYSFAVKGTALDIGAGGGRNSLFLSAEGFQVTSLDISDIALSHIKKTDPTITTRVTDLKDHNLQEQAFDLIININFLQRNLFPEIVKALKPGGLLIFQTFLDSPHLHDNNHFIHRNFYLKTNELLQAFLELEVILYQEEGVLKPQPEQKNVASLIAKKNYQR